jgi:Transposase
MKPKAQEKNEKITKPRTNHWKKMNRKQRRKLTRKIQSQDLSLEVVHTDAAGIDIGNESHYVAVPSTRDSQPVRRFGCTTGELKAMAEWLKQCRIRTVAMQSTGVYWVAVYDILEQAGFEAYHGGLYHNSSTASLQVVADWLSDRSHRGAVGSDLRGNAKGRSASP